MVADAQELRTFRLQAAGCETRVLAIGTGTPVLLLHGIFDDGESFVPLMRMLAGRGFACYAIDLPGFGQAQLGDDVPCGTEDSARWAWALIDALEQTGESPQPWWMVGHSMGSGVAARMASLMPERTNGLVMLAPAPHVGSSPMAPKWLPARLFAWVFGVASRNDCFERIVRKAYGSDVVARKEALRDGLSREGLAAYTLRLVTVRCRHGVYQGRTLAVFALRDRVVRRSERKIRALAPNACFSSVEGASHGFHETRAAEVFTHMVAFMTKNSYRG